MIRILYEDITAVKRYYPNIDDDTFMELITLDPTYTGKDSVGKYGKWLLNLYNRGKISESDFEEIPDLLNQFTTYKNRIQNKDLNAYKTLDDLAETLASVIDDMSMLTPNQKTKFLKKVKTGKIAVDKSDDYDIVLDTPNFIVYIPNTHEASMKLGKGTKWCTAHENPDWYDNYTEDNKKLYIIKNKDTSERWQYSDLSGDFLDQNDEEFNIAELMQQDKQLSKFFEKFLNFDYYNFDGTWIYDGNEIPNNLKRSIKKVVVDNNITFIEGYAFEDCKNLISITIPNTVTAIYYCAFLNCTSLKSITIPNSVTYIGERVFSNCTSLTYIKLPEDIKEISKSLFFHCESLEHIIIPNQVIIIGDSAFRNCKSLKDIIIPNSVTKIWYSAFMDCSSLLSVTIPNSVEKIRASAFCNCDNLTIYTDNNYVKEYCEEDDIPTKPLNAKNESYKPFRLRIKEY